jgi:hypothetical protein
MGLYCCEFLADEIVLDTRRLPSVPPTGSLVQLTLHDDGPPLTYYILEVVHILDDSLPDDVRVEIHLVVAQEAPDGIAWD